MIRTHVKGTETSEKNKIYTQLHLELFGIIFIKQGFVSAWSPRKLIGLTHEVLFLFAVCMGLCCPSVLLMNVSDKMGEGCCFPCCFPQTALFGLRTKLRIQENIEVKMSFNPSGKQVCFLKILMKHLTVSNSQRCSHY